MKAVTMLSGGLDSTVLAYHLRDEGYDLHALSFDYGQKHKKEIQRAYAIANLLKVPFHVIELSAHWVGKGMVVEDSGPLASVLGGSTLVSDNEVPDGHYAEENMKATVVPNRNMIMLSIAYGVAVGEKADLVAFGAHLGDHTIYPDCRPEFVRALARAMYVGNRWDPEEALPEFAAPWLELGYDKMRIVLDGARLGVPFSETWSCYKGGAVHCGRCGTCVERAEAFALAGVPDPTVYQDPNYWRTVTKEADLVDSAR